MIATSLLVVPRSMPMMVSMDCSPSLRFKPGGPGSVVSRWFVDGGVRQGGVRCAIRFLVIFVALAAHRPDLGQAEDAAPPGVSSPQLLDDGARRPVRRVGDIDDDHPLGIDRAAQAGDRLDGL